MIGKRFPHRADAGAAARLQPDLHRLRPHPRVRIDHHGARAARGVPGGGGRVRRADRLHLRRRAAAVPADRRAGRAGILERNRHIYLCTNGMFIRKRLRRVPARPRASSSTSTWTAWRRRTTCAWSAKASSSEAIEGIKAAKAAGFKVCTNTTVYKETDMREIEALFEYLEQFDVDGHSSRRPTATRR